MATYTLITGASAGIGVAFARIAAKEKRNIILTARREDRLNGLADELRTAGAGEVHVITADLADEADVDRLWEAATKIGTIDFLVNNAGLGGYGKFAESDWWRERQSIAVNVIAPTLLAKKAVPHMIEADVKARILNVASLAGFLPGPNMAVYHATKAYILSLSNALSEELSNTKIGVTALCPGPVDTEFFEEADNGHMPMLKTGMMQSPEEVAKVGWTAAKLGRPVAVPGASNKFAAAMTRVTPRPLLMKVMSSLTAAEGESTPFDRFSDWAGKARERASEAGSQLAEKAKEARAKVAEDGGLADTIKSRASELRTRAHITGEEGGEADGTIGRLKSTFSSGLSSAGEVVTAAAKSAKDRKHMNTEMAEQMRSGTGFIAALDQSGGSTPKALRQYGVEDDAWSGEEEMFDRIHEMRARIVTAPAFTGDKVIGAILFEQTMDRDFEGVPAPTYLWENKHVVPFLKVDKGLEDEKDGVQLMKDMGDLGLLLRRARDKGVFGTKMRSVVNAANKDGIAANISQQFEIGHQILGMGLMPILEPEVNITIEDKAEAEAILRDEILSHLSNMNPGAEIMLKLSLPSHDGFYTDLIEHPNVMRVVALSGGYSRDEANELLARNPGMIASFSRALAEGLSYQQSDDEFNATIAESINSIYAASAT